MLAVEPTMDGDFPPHELPPPGGGIQLQNRLLHCPWWGSFSPPLYPSFSSENQQFVGSTPFLGGQSCPETSYPTTATVPSFFSKSSDFPQDPSCLEDLSNASVFSSSVDSLSDIPDTPDFLPADSLNEVPTIWDVSTTSATHDKLFLPSGPFPALEDPVTSLSSTPLLISYQSHSQPEEEEGEEEEEAEELGHAETYADYVPSKSKIGKQHPDRVVETSTLSSVPPPDITYTLALPTSDSGTLSALQLEAITYACQQHEVLLPSGQRAGFLIGDGAGVGKGRTVAGIIVENYLRGRKKALWFSASNDLKYDAERDLRDIEAPGIAVHALSKIKYGDNTTSEGVLFATYSALIGESQAGGQHRTRLRQILQWCGEAFDGVIVFDECHKAKNASSTKMGKAVLDLQSKLPQARVVYASATGASEPRNMIYMSRLGIWGEGTPFRTFEEFLHAIEKRGVGAMEIVAMDMKVSGMYIARQLSFSGVTFRIEEIPLSPAFEQLYNRAARLWAEALTVFQQAADWIGLESRKSLWGQFWSAHQRFFKYLCIAAKVHRLVELARQELSRDKCVVIGLQSTGEARTREVLDENEGRLDCFVSAAEGVFLSLIQKHFPSSRRRRDRGGGKRKRRPRGRGPKASRLALEATGVIRISDGSSTESDAGLDSDFNSSPESLVDDDVVIIDTPTPPTDDRGPLYPLQRDLQGPGVLERVERLKQGLLAKVRALGRELPVNTLDQLIHQLGGPECVAEMTGRKGRVVSRPDGSVVFESRAEQGLSIDHVNLREKQRFMSGEKLVAIISEASSSGVSLQADRRVQNQRRRVHMTLELPWSADRAIQQFGRTHRSNQVSAPEYVFLISELAGERRFASIVAKRLESLGALTHGDRRATESRDLSKYNFENKYGARALSRVLATIMGQTDNRVPLPQGYPGGDAAFFRDMKQGLLSVGIGSRESRSGCLDVEKDCSITKFLNRILGLEVHKQNALFQYFSDTFDRLIEMDKKEGRYDMGILDLAPGINEIHEESQQVFLAPGHPQDGQVVFYKQISVDRGMKWEEAFTRSLELKGPYDGFYLSYKVRGSKTSCLLAEQNRGEYFTVYKPNIGRQSQLETLDSLCRKFHRVTAEEAREPWESSYALSLEHCSHTTWNQRCRLAQEGKCCAQGLRLRHHYMLCGALLRVWGRIAAVMADVSSSSYLQIVRLKTKDKKKQVGIKIPEGCVHRVLQELQLMDAEVRRRSTHGLAARPPTPRAITLPCGPGEVLDLTYSPPAEAFPAPPRFTFPSLPPPDPSSLMMGARDPATNPVELAHQSCDINFREVLEDMLRSLRAGPTEAPAPLVGVGGGGTERQSVIHFSPPFPNS
ncbi:protein strawberry notch homolog 2 isoform X1 [Arvicanthis niloticus]|uniref:protein strawberry notch homolog 2 isoform X1 n=1 Tax=Arvicanthis niloticus TaxID=61156 RepID=UPI0014865CEB|nr:protein strawberry notch homolog 2 isoform X1 [Arvicanthis niloticus]